MVFELPVPPSEKYLEVAEAAEASVGSLVVLQVPYCTMSSGHGAGWRHSVRTRCRLQALWHANAQDVRNYRSFHSRLDRRSDMPAAPAMSLVPSRRADGTARRCVESQTDGPTAYQKEYPKIPKIWRVILSGLV